jgi:TolB-like protein/DNA-binding winged helix-turn-helix (wHTH) protein
MGNAFYCFISNAYTIWKALSNSEAILKSYEMCGNRRAAADDLNCAEMDGGRYLSAGALCLDLQGERAWLGKTQLRLGSKATALLRLLMEQPGELVTKSAIFDSVWQGLAVSDAVLTTAVKELRQALGDDARDPHWLETVHGRGYRFLPSVAEAEERPASTLIGRPGLHGLRKFSATTWTIITALAALVPALGYLSQRVIKPREPTTQTAAIAVQPKSIAVLPFADYSSAGGQAWFGEGLTEEILNSLTHTPDLIVAARSSSASVEKDDVREIGRKLRVANVLEGSVRREGRHVRVTAELIRTSDGYRLWSQNFDRDINDVISIQEDIAVAIAQRLNTVMDPAQLRAMATLGTRNVDAYEEYLHGLAFERQRFATGDIKFARLSADSFEKARELDPTFAAAHWRSAITWWSWTGDSWDHDEPSLAVRLKNYQDRLALAIQASGDRPERLKYGSAQALSVYDFRTAFDLIKTYVKQRPRDVDGLEALIGIALDVGDRRTASETSARLQQVGLESGDPRPRAISGSALSLNMSQAVAFARQQLELRPNDPPILWQAHRAFLWAGRRDEARQILPRLLSSHFTQSVALAQIHQACADGQPDRAEALYQQLKNRPDAFSGNLWYASLALGRRAQALRVSLEPKEPDRSIITSISLLFPMLDVHDYPWLDERFTEQRLVRPPAVGMPHACV